MSKCVSESTTMMYSTGPGLNAYVWKDFKI